MEQKYEKAAENAKKSVDLNATIKGFFRLGQSLKMAKRFDEACSAYMKAIQLDVSDPNDI